MNTTPNADEATPFITVALCTHNHADRLTTTLESLRVLSAPDRPWEFLVIDNGSTDETPRILAQAGLKDICPLARVVREDRLGLSNARNRALADARGDYLIFMDDDETPDPGWLRAYECALVSHEPDAVGGKIEVFFEDGERPLWLQDELLGFLGKLDHGEPRWLDTPDTPIFGGNFGFRTKVFDKIGNFDPMLGRKGTQNTGGEDTEIYRRLIEHGCRVRWVPDAVINHRIQAPKIKRGYFLDLHYRQGRMEGARTRGEASCIPPRYLYPQWFRACWRAVRKRFSEGSNQSLRQEMNAFYFAGYLIGWIRD